MNIRLAQKEDLLGILDCLEVLSDVTFTNWQNIEKAFDDREASGNIITLVVVSESIHSHYGNTLDDYIMGTASLFIQRKLSHDGKCVAIIEDVAVRRECQGLGIGKWLIESCIDYARNVGCYKVILNCEKHNEDFYAKFNFQSNGQIEMRLDLQ